MKPPPQNGGNSKRIVDVEPLSDLFLTCGSPFPTRSAGRRPCWPKRKRPLPPRGGKLKRSCREAQEQREKLLDEASVAKEAELRAKEMILKARNNAEIITDGARRYTDDILVDLQRYLGEYIEIIEKNRRELSEAYAQEGEEPEAPQENTPKRRRKKRPWRSPKGARKETSPSEVALGLFIPPLLRQKQYKKQALPAAPLGETGAPLLFGVRLGAGQAPAFAAERVTDASFLCGGRLRTNTRRSKPRSRGAAATARSPRPAWWVQGAKGLRQRR